MKTSDLPNTTDSLKSDSLKSGSPESNSLKSDSLALESDSLESDSLKSGSLALESIREYFRQDCFATDNGVVIEAVEDGMARCSMILTGHHRNAVGAVMGGAIFTLADFAFAVASNWQGTVHVSRTSQITFLGTVKGGQLTATARRVKEGRRTCYYTVEIRDELGTLVAQAAVDGYVKADIVHKTE